MKKHLSFTIGLLLVVSMLFGQFQATKLEANNSQFSSVSSAGRVLNELPSTVEKHFDTEFLSQLGSAKTPASYDLRTVSNGAYLSPVRDQGLEGACWTFATYGAVESYWLKQGWTQKDMSEQNMATCHGFDGAPGDGGNYDMAMAYLSRRSGPITETADPYTLPANPNCVSGLTPAAYINQARYLPGKDDEGYSASFVKQAVLDNGAIYVNMCYEDAYMNQTATTDYTYYYNGTGATNHAVLLVGWDDNKVVTGGSAATPTAPGAWIIRNSWGEDWGQDGYFYLSYEDTKALTSVAYFPSTSTYETSSHVYGYDELGMMTAFGALDSDNYGLVKFTAVDGNPLKSVGTYVTSTNTNVEIKVYSTFDGTNVSGLLATIPSQSCMWPGYYTFDFDAPVTMASGSDFYVVIKYDCTEQFCVPFEAVVPNHASSATIETGKCWLSNTGTSWTAFGQGTDYEYDLCVKVYSSAVAAGVPEAEFTATSTTVGVGTAVDFIDQSTGVPSSWSWTFEGANETSSTLQNPSATWSNPGTYDVTLTVTNSFGSDVITKTDYITVEVVCANQNNILEGESLYVYTLGAGGTAGYMLGHNQYGINKVAEKIIDPVNPNLTSVTLDLAVLKSTSANPKITLKVWDVGTDNLPSTELYSQDVPYSELSTAELSQISLDAPVVVDGTFFVGYEFYYAGNDTIASTCVEDRGTESTATPTIFVYYNNAWNDGNVLFSGHNSAMGLMVELCPDEPEVPEADFTVVSTSVCLGQPAVFNNTSTFESDLYSWNFGDGQFGTDENPSHIYAAAGTYTASLTINVDGVDYTKEQEITVNDNPTVDLGADQTICEGTELAIPATASMTSYLWSNDQTTSSITVTTGGTFSVTITDANGCTATDEMTVTANPSPSVDLGEDQIFCGTSEDVVLDAGTHTSYAWSSGETTSTLTVTTSGDYGVTVTSANGCTANDEVSINYHPAASITLADDANICPAELPYQLDAGSNNASYAWNDGSTSQVLNINAAGTFNVTITDANGCTATDEFVLTLKPEPTVTLDESLVACDTELPVDVTAETTATNIEWASGETAATISVASAGTYVVTVTNAEGCEATDQIVVNVVAAPVVDLGDDVVICADAAPVTLNPNTGDEYTYSWSNNETTESISVTESGDYSVTVTVASCSANDEVTVTVNPNPQAFNVTGTGAVDDQGFAHINLDGSETGVVYTLYKDEAEFATLDGTGEALVFDIQNSGTYAITARFTETECEEEMNGEAVIIVDGISDLTSSQVEVYPNPVEDVLYINAENGVEEVFVFATDGRLVKQINESVKEVSFDDMPKGVYVVKVKSANRISTFRVVKR